MIKELYVEKFRLMENLTLPLGKKVTVIAGQNATCKSTLLGMIGQPFGMKDRYTIFGKPFSAKFSDIFKWSRTKDKPREHKYLVKFYDTSLCGKDVASVESYERKNDASHIRLVTGKKRGRNDGNIYFPVVYLGLKRVYPIGELRDEIRESIPTLTPEEIRTFSKWYNNIFFPLEEVSPVQITSKKQKDTLAVTSTTYDYFANSAGQDNIGQILGAILSFRRLRKNLGDEYRGGLLLIDELDATLFPAAQVNLIDLFYSQAGKLNLQFVFTTHSLSALEHAIQRQHDNDDTKILYFTRVFGKLDSVVDPTFARIGNDLNIATADPPKSPPKINLYCEDAEASWFTKKLLGPQTKYANVSTATFGGDFLKTLAEKNIAEFNDSVFVLDGDKKPRHVASNVLLLPGGSGALNPENVFRELLHGMSPDDDFWHNDRQYTQQVFESNLFQLTRGAYDNRVLMKKWFKAERKNWGRGCSSIYKSWLTRHPSEAKDFRDGFIRVHNNIAKRRSIPLI